MVLAVNSSTHNFTNIIDWVECHSKAAHMLEPVPLPWEKTLLPALMCCLGMHKSDTALHYEVHIWRAVCCLMQPRHCSIDYQLYPEHSSQNAYEQDVL